MDNSNQMESNTPPLRRQPRIKILNPMVKADTEKMIRNLLEEDERRTRNELLSKNIKKIINKYKNMKI